MSEENLDRLQLAQYFKELESASMPFGRFGPEFFPPHGIALIDLPYEYLEWFKQEGFPRGRLGELMEMVYQVKSVGAGEVFTKIRVKKGGRMSLHKRKKDHGFSDDRD